MMTAPHTRTLPPPSITVCVESPPGSGRFAADPRLHAVSAECGCLPDAGAAIVEAQLDESFGIAEARARYYPDRRVLICADQAPPDPPAVLFDGFPARHEHVIQPAGAAREQYRLHLLAIAAHLARRSDAHAAGRIVRRAGAANVEWSAGADDPPAIDRLTALPCVFNAGGRPNRSRDPLVIRRSDGGARVVHLFTWDDAPDARPWTAIQAIRYLLFFHARTAALVDCDALFAETDDAAAEPTPEGRAAWRVNDPLRFDLLALLDHLDIETQDVCAALSAVCRATGLLLWTETRAAAAMPGEVSSELRPVCRWRIGGFRGAMPQFVQLAQGGRDSSGAPLYNTIGRRIRDILSDNQLDAGRIEWDESRQPAPAVVLGRPRESVVTVPLWPGWLPQPQLDNVPPAGRAAAKAAALTPAQVLALSGDPDEHEWLRRHHARGAEFRAHWAIARYWVLNEDGAFGSAYDRHAPFDAYARFDFAALLEGAPLAGAFWSGRPRRFRPIPNGPLGLTPGCITVRLSFDAGATWTTLPRGYRVLADRCGLWFDVDNPLEITPANADPAVQNLWYALIDQSLRIRVTASVESDERLLAAARELHPTRSLQPIGSVIRLPERSAVAPAGDVFQVTVPTDPLDDEFAAHRWIEDVVHRHAGSAIEFRPHIPWLEWDTPLGTSIAALRGREVGFDSQRAPARRHLTLIGRAWRFSTDSFGTTWRLTTDSSSPAANARTTQE